MSSPNVSKQKASKKRISYEISYEDFIKESILESAQRDKPDEFMAYVREVVQYQADPQDFFFSNTDPFHFPEVNEKRMKNAGFIKNYRQVTYMHVEIPAVFNNMFSTEKNPQVTLFTLVKVDITDLKRKPAKGDIVYVKFKDPKALTGPSFSSFKQDKQGRSVVKNDDTEPFRIQGRVFGVSEEEVA